MHQLVEGSPVVDLSDGYERHLRAFLVRPDERGLAAAYGTGRLALEGGMGLIELAEVHWRAYSRIVRGTVATQAETELSSKFLEEALVPYEMALSGYRESSHALQLAIEQLQRVNLMKTRFFNYLNHELRTPLNSILGFADLIGIERVGPLTPMQIRYQGNILSGGRHMLALINEMLDMAKIEAGKMQVANEEIDLAAVVATAVEQTASLAAKSEVEVLVAMRAVPPAAGDPQRILQVFLNVVGNALKFTPRGGRVTIELNTSVDGLVVDISDTGPGIPPEKLEEIFDEFSQAEMFESAAPLSTGLGLPLSRALLTLMNGSIAARSTMGQGSTFSLMFRPWIAPGANDRRVSTRLTRPGSPGSEPAES